MVVYHSDARNNTNLPNNLIQNDSTTVMLLLFLTITLLNRLTRFAYICGILNRGINASTSGTLRALTARRERPLALEPTEDIPVSLVFYSIRYNVFCYRIKKQRGRILLQANGK